MRIWSKSAQGDPVPGRQEPTLRHRDDIQGLRAVAVLLVALSHAGVGFVKGGFVGVDVFFVLSGFLITGLLVSEARRRRWVSLGDFYMRRARRILPAAALTLLVTDVAAYHLLNFVRAKQYLEDSIPSAFFAANIHFAAQGTDYFAQGQPPSPLQHFWSLAVEEQFYIVWPALFILMLGLSFRRFASRPPVVRERAVRRVLIGVVFLSLVSLAWSVQDTASHPASAYFSTFARAWELGLGVALALGVSRFESLSADWRTAMGWTGLGLIAIVAVTFSGSTHFPGFAALLPTVGAALVIAAGVSRGPPRRSAGRVLGIAPLRYVGDRSYAFYLWHWPMLVIVAQRAGHNLSVGENLLLLVAAFGLSVVSYALFERPIRFAQWTRRPQSLALAVIVSLLALVAIPTTWISSISSRETSLAAAAAPAPVLAPAPAQTKPTAGGQSTPAAATGVSQQVPAVIHEVDLLFHHPALPSALNPPVGQLLSDIYVLPSNCYAQAGQTSSGICRLAASSSSKTIAVIGDSHAEMWMPDVLSLAQRAGWAVVPLIKVGCSPTEWIGSQGTADCRAWFRWAMREGNAQHPTVTLIAGKYSDFGGATDLPAVYGVDAAARAMKKRSGRVVIIGDVPERTGEPVDCLLRPHATASGCSDLLHPSEAQLTSSMAQLAGFDHVGFIDTTGWFCYQSQCPLVIGNVITYRDANHVSQTYATALRAVFRSAVDLAAEHGKPVF